MVNYIDVAPCISLFVLLGSFEKDGQAGVICPGATGQMTARVGTSAPSIRCDVMRSVARSTRTAMRYDRILKEFYQRLRTAGKKPLVAMTACMRKLVILMNQLLKNDHFQLAN